MTNIELHCIQKPANSYSCKVNNLADVKRKLLICNTLLQFHAIILNELTMGGGGVLHYLTLTGMCSLIGYSFHKVLS